jgi:diguanylate cyclase
MSTPSSPASDAPSRTAKPTKELLAEIGELFFSIPVPVLVADGKGTIVLANPELEELLGYPAGALIGENVEILVPTPLRHAHASHRTGYLQDPRARRMGVMSELVACRRDGADVPVEIALKPLHAEDDTLVLCVLLDLTARKRLELQLREQNRSLEARVAQRTLDLERRNRDTQALLDSLEKARAELERLSREDALTGLTNRREFFVRARSELRRAERRQSRTAIAMLDLDHFKRVNDELGHVVGDRVLQRVARLLRSQCRLDDVVARYGGEEFALLLPETDLVSAATICERIRRTMEQTDWRDEGVGWPVTVSIGVVQCRPGETETDALERADRLLYLAKGAGRNRCVSDA